MLTLYQAEWCPFSAAARELLTEHGIAFVARPVEPRPEQRDGLRKRAGTDEIPVLETEDGAFHRGADAIFAYLRTLDSWEHAAAHRERYREHLVERRAAKTGKLLEAA
jgi:glutathione S-transferase